MLLRALSKSLQPSAHTALHALSWASAPHAVPRLNSCLRLFRPCAQVLAERARGPRHDQRVVRHRIGPRMDREYALFLCFSISCPQSVVRICAVALRHLAASFGLCRTGRAQHPAASVGSLRTCAKCLGSLTCVCGRAAVRDTAFATGSVGVFALVRSVRFVYLVSIPRCTAARSWDGPR